MADSTTLGPIVVSRDASGVRITLAPHVALEAELPVDYETSLSRHLANVGKDPATAAISIDLQQLPAITSRQLGALLALHRVARRGGGPIRVVNITPTVQKVFQATNTAQFFQFS